MIFQETERTELKRVLNDTIQKEIVAFLNSFDGTIYIGVNDDGSILGVENLDETQKKIADIVTYADFAQSVGKYRTRNEIC